MWDSTYVLLFLAGSPDRPTTATRQTSASPCPFHPGRHRHVTWVKPEKNTR